MRVEAQHSKSPIHTTRVKPGGVKPRWSQRSSVAQSRESCGEREDCMRKGCTRRELHLADAKVER